MLTSSNCNDARGHFQVRWAIDRWYSTLAIDSRMIQSRSLRAFPFRNGTLQLSNQNCADQKYTKELMISTPQSVLSLRLCIPGGPSTDHNSWLYREFRLRKLKLVSDVLEVWSTESDLMLCELVSVASLLDGFYPGRWFINLYIQHFYILQLAIGQINKKTYGSFESLWKVQRKKDGCGDSRSRYLSLSKQSWSRHMYPSIFSAYKAAACCWWYRACSLYKYEWVPRYGWLACCTNWTLSHHFL